MAASKEYTVTELYQWLKLDIWRSGRVIRWGHVKKVAVRSDHSTVGGYFLPKALSSYNSFSLAKQLAVGVYLLDFRLVKKDVLNKQIVSQVLIAVCRTTMAQLQTIHCLEITNTLELSELRSLISDNPPQISMRKRKSPFSAKRTPRTFDSSPFNSIRR